MRINFNTPIAFNSLRMRQINGMSFPDNFQCRSSNKIVYDISIGNEYGAYQINYLHKDKLEADQEINLDKDLNYVYVDNMYTNTSRRGKGLGVCMHLTNIIEMMENQLDRIELYAVSEAIPFHFKCGFKPNDNWELLQKNIRCIANDKTPELKMYSDEAKLILKFRCEPQLRSKLGNQLMYEYIKKAITIKSKEEQQSMFEIAVPMLLTREDVIKNKDFYNKLFDKYNIDYKI